LVLSFLTVNTMKDSIIYFKKPLGLFTMNKPLLRERTVEILKTKKNFLRDFSIQNYIRIF
jgi:hypothetical protein